MRQNLVGIYIVAIIEMMPTRVAQFRVALLFQGMGGRRVTLDEHRIEHSQCCANGHLILSLYVLALFKHY